VVDKPKLLVLESLHHSGIDALASSFEIVNAVGMEREHYLKILPCCQVAVCKSVTRVDQEFIDAASELKILGRIGSGVDNIDVDRLSARSIKLFTTPDGNTASTAEFAVMCMLMACRNAVPAYCDTVTGMFRREVFIGRELQNLTVGIFGYGRVGKAVANLLKGFGSRIIIYSPSLKKGDLGDLTVEPDLKKFVRRLDLLSLHASMTSKSAGIINTTLLDHAKPGLLLVNTARGGLLVDHDILIALNNGMIGYLVTDTLNPEPQYDLVNRKKPVSHCLLGHPKILIFPHLGASTSDAQERMALELVDKLNGAFT